jgi:hypothetical protein
MIKVLVRIREVETGKEIDSYHDVEEKYRDNQRFYYEEGNGSCDCNRKLMFGYARGIEFSDEETPCTGGRYVVQVIIDGETILNEFGG